MSDPMIVVSENGQGYRIQWGTYFDEKGAGNYGTGRSTGYDDYLFCYNCHKTSFGRPGPESLFIF